MGNDKHDTSTQTTRCECFKCTNNATILLKISNDSTMNLCDKCFKNIENNLKQIDGV